MITTDPSSTEPDNRNEGASVRDPGRDHLL